MREANRTTVKSSIKRLRISPQKLNLVAALIRGKGVEQAMQQLQFCSKRIAKDVLQALRSGIANAENNFGLDIDNLRVKEATVGKALVMKRMRARARGRSARINKPFSNLYLTLVEASEE